MRVAAEAHARLTHLIVYKTKLLFRQPVRHVFRWLEGEDLCQIEHRMTCHCEGQLRLASGMLLHTGDEQRAGIEDRGEGANPALVGMLGTKVAEQRVRDVTLE